jgi:hypothetical protein
MEDKNMKYTFEKWLVTHRKNEEGEISGYALFNSIDNPDIHFPMEVFVSESDMKENEVYDFDV